LSALLWFTGMPLVLALAAALVIRVERARERGNGDWTGLEIGDCTFRDFLYLRLQG
jgi:hypothetical protein